MQIHFNIIAPSTNSTCKQYVPFPRPFSILCFSWSYATAAVELNYSVFWVITRCKMVFNRRFETTYRSHFEGLSLTARCLFQTTLRSVKTQETEELICFSSLACVLHVTPTRINIRRHKHVATRALTQKDKCRNVDRKPWLYFIVQSGIVRFIHESKCLLQCTQRDRVPVVMVLTNLDPGTQPNVLLCSRIV